MKNLRGYILSFLAFVVFITIVGLATGGWAYESKSSNLKNVRVEIMPAQLIPGQPAQFKVQMTTHSVELNYDVVKLSTLKDDTGREYQALKWDGDPPVGHHRSGVLEFPAIAKGTKSITLYIKNIAGVPERLFKWTLEQ
ncbi:MAG: hypothetical protein ABIJ25_14685 [Pseudomonadota bacterium]